MTVAPMSLWFFSLLLVLISLSIYLATSKANPTFFAKQSRHRLPVGYGLLQENVTQLFTNIFDLFFLYWTIDRSFHGILKKSSVTSFAIVSHLHVFIVSAISFLYFREGQRINNKSIFR